MPRPITLRLAVLGLLVCGSGGCAGGMTGTYEDENGVGRLEFQQDGTVYVSYLGVTIAGEYELDGEHVIVAGPNGSQVLTRNGTRLEAGPGLTYIKK